MAQNPGTTWNVSCWSRGLMGYQTPNIDRLAKEGVAFNEVPPNDEGLSTEPVSWIFQPHED
jgi:hypothetical protein